MSVNSPLTTDIRNFLDLLQNNPDNIHKRSLSLESDKLSIIYSASEPESSLTDKENSRNSSNTSEANNEIENISIMFKEIRKTNLTFEQQTLLQRLEILLDDIKKHFTINESKIKVMETQLSEEKKTTDEILKALVKMDESEKELWANYSALSDKNVLIEKEYKILMDKNMAIVKENMNLEEQNKEIWFLKEENKSLKRKLENMIINQNEFHNENEQLKIQLKEKHSNIEFMKKLVLVANENYENIENQFKNQNKNNIIEKLKEQKSSPEITSRSINKCNKSSCSPSVSEKSISVRKGSFEENYRRLVLRTLKSKANK